MSHRAIFLDRDGTVVRLINRQKTNPELVKGFTAPFLVNEINFEPHLREAVKIFRDFGYKIAVATNQPDVAYGLLPEKRWKKIHNIIMREVEPDYWIACRHTRDAGCVNKKPSPGMLIAIAEYAHINLKQSFMIGDTENDMLAGRRAGCKTILIRRYYNVNNKEANENADYCVNSLLEAVAVV